MRRGRLDLPIDHFRLLGVSPASDAQTVLRTLAQRLDRVPDQGFTTDTLQARAKLLHDSADLLSDSERRAAYESELMALDGGASSVPALDIPGSLEVAGLLLLLEAGQAQEAFDLACRALQPPQAPALGSSREADLSLVAGLACLASAEESRNRRHFEASARQLQQGLQLLQRMGQLPEMRQRLVHDLDGLAPYLVLDLLSRELTAPEKRAEGLQLLELLVQRRGGLEGDQDPAFNPEEFQAFFKQIRGFLTVQEQLDLYSRWAEAGSEAADFLASVALTASGFAQRKPERIAAARQRLLASGRSGIEPLLACLHLLLGEVDLALATFAEGASPELLDWAEQQSPDSLGQLCAYCRDWLANDVLPGYRDLEADPDLDAYFADRDVIVWVEREDRRSGRHYAPPLSEPISAGVPAGSTPLAVGEANFDWPDPAGLAGPGMAVVPLADPAAPLPGDPFAAEPEDEAPLRWRLPALGSLAAALRRPASQPPSHPASLEQQSDWRPSTWPLAWRVVVAVALGLGTFMGVLLLRSRAPQAPARGVVTLPVQPQAGTGSPPAATPGPSRPASGAADRPPVAKPDYPDSAATQPATPAAPAGSAGSSPRAGLAIRPLTAADPSDDQFRDLLQTWLSAKAAVLAGAPLPAELELIARAGPIRMLRGERREDAAAGQTQTIDVRVEAVRVTRRSGGRVAVLARLSYSDTRRDASGSVVDRTPRQTLRNEYIFGQDDGRWRLAATLPAS